MTRRTAVAAIAACVAFLAACNPDTVRVEFAPSEGSVYEYRYEVDSTTTRVLSDTEPVETDRSSVILADHTVLASDAEGIRIDVVLRRDQEAARSYLVRFDRGAQLTGIELVDGVALGTLGQGGLEEILSGSVFAPPSRPLRPGESWSIDTELTLPGATEPVPVDGKGRLVKLEVLDGTNVATVETSVTLPVSGITEDARTRLEGMQETSTSVSYDLVDGSVVEASSLTLGEVSLVIQPPEGILGPPVEGTLRYEIGTTTERLSATNGS